MIDLSPMQAPHVDPEARSPLRSGGAIWGDVDHETQPFGLATPGGIVSKTGVARLTLGGGFGWPSRKYGLSADNLLSAELVTAEGEFVKASAEESADLFWAIRGGGGNFGVVTSFELQLHEVGPKVLFGPTVHGLDDAAEVLRHYRDFARGAPNGCSVYADLLTAPTPYTAVQTTFDPLLPKGGRYYWKSHDLSGISDQMIDTVVARARRLPTAKSDILIHQFGGVINDPFRAATAHPHRDIDFVVTLGGFSEEPAQDEPCIAWARECHAELGEYAAASVCLNFLSHGEGEARLRSAYGGNAERLRTIKTRYDPENLFRRNHNVPAGA